MCDIFYVIGIQDYTNMNWFLFTTSLIVLQVRYFQNSKNNHTGLERGILVLASFTSYMTLIRLDCNFGKTPVDMSNK